MKAVKSACRKTKSVCNLAVRYVTEKVNREVMAVQEYNENDA